MKRRFEAVPGFPTQLNRSIAAHQPKFSPRDIPFSARTFPSEPLQIQSHFQHPISSFLDLFRMKADQSLSNIFRQLRPCLSRTYAQPCYVRPYSQFAAFGPPIIPKSQRAITPASLRFASSNHYPVCAFQTRRQATTAAPSVPIVSEAGSELPPEIPPAYELTFTCKPCLHRSTHNVTKLGYHKGTVLIKCPNCKNQHLISDHLKIFEDKSVTIEDLMRRRGNLVKRGHLSAGGDVEFWDDGTQTERKKDGSQSEQSREHVL